MRRRVTLLFALAAIACAGCATTEPEPAVPAEPGLELGSAASQTPPSEPPAVIVRVKQQDGRFVAEVVDVRAATAGAPPPDAASRKRAVDRLQSLLGDRVKVVDPHATP